MFRRSERPRAIGPLLDAAALHPREAGVALLADALAGPPPRRADPAAHARLLETLGRLHEQLVLNRRPPCLWTAAQRARLFDPDWLVRRCAGRPLLAAAAHRAWRDGAQRLAANGEDVAALAWAALTGAPPQRPAGRRVVSAAG